MWQILLKLTIAYVVSSVIHELGHIMVGWLQGARGAQIRFGTGSGPALNLKLGPVRLTVRLGLGLLLSPPVYLFAAGGNRHPLARFVRAAAGPMASFLLYWVVAAEPVPWIRAFFQFRFPVESFATALAFWAWVQTFGPLVPMHYRGVDLPSDGLTMWRAVAELWRGRARTRDASRF